MATVKRKASKATKSEKPTKVKYLPGKSLTILFGDPDNIEVETPDELIDCEQEDFPIPTEEEIQEALAEMLC